MEARELAASSHVLAMRVLVALIGRNTQWKAVSL